MGLHFGKFVIVSVDLLQDNRNVSSAVSVEQSCAGDANVTSASAQVLVNIMSS